MLYFGFLTCHSATDSPGLPCRLPSERKPVLVRESAPVVTGASHLKPDRRSTSDLVEPSPGVADLATYFGIPPAGAHPASHSDS